MSHSRLVLRGLVHYWRTNVAVVLGVATAVAVLAGALVVGDSVRGSLRDLLVQQLGRTDLLVISSGFVREALADDLRSDEAFRSSFASICPVIAVQGLVTHQASGRRVSRVMVYGVDDRFWQFHGVTAFGGPDDRDALLSPALASDIGAAAGQTVLVRVERPSAIPIESLHGRKEDPGRTMRLTVRAIAGPTEMGEFSLRPQQGQVRAVFVPLKTLQQELDRAGRVNALLVSQLQPAALTRSAPRASASLEELLRRRAAIDDLGLTLRVLDSQHVVAVEGQTGLLDEVRASAAAQAGASAGLSTRPVFSYLVNSLRSGNREVPYSLVTAIDLASVTTVPAIAASPGAPPPIVINDWTARDLGVAPGALLTLEFSVWEEPGQLVTRIAEFRIAAVVPIKGSAADRDLAPVYPGITESDTLGDWDPPFPIDLRRVRPSDEDYWHTYRTTPKAFIPFEVGQALWRSRYGDRTSVRVGAAAEESLTSVRDLYASRLRATLDPLAAGISVRDVRAEGLGASAGATDFGEYFTYFSFFLVVSALMLAALFFRLGVEQRVREVGLLRAVGFTTRAVRRLFATEGLVLAAMGSVAGVLGAVGYAAVMMAGLRTWWSDAVGTTALGLHVSVGSLATGAGATVVAAMVCIWWTLRGLARISERSLLAGTLAGDAFVATTSTAGHGGRADALGAPPVSPRSVVLRPALAGAIGFGVLGLTLVGATMGGRIDRTGAFFGAGASLLVACLCLIAYRLRRRPRSLVAGRGWWTMVRLGVRNAANRPGRSVLAIGVIASATFILISVDAFRRDAPSAVDRHSGVGGYPLLVDLLLPLAHDPNSRDGREALGVAAFDGVTVEPFRVLPGDDTSCLNLYEPRNPRVLGVSRRFVEAGRFGFDSSLASNEAERANPWLLLNRQFAGEGGGAVIPVIGDANSLTYVLHKKLGEDIVIRRGASDVRLRVVAMLADSIFQSELLMSDANFQTLFPAQEGFRFLLVDAPEARVAQVAAAIEASGGDIGADAASTTARLAEFHRVENTYLSTFQALGGLGLLVGTLGLAAVLMRNVLERRRELALLGAVGYRRAHVFTIVLAENAVLLGWGLAVGTVCAVVAIAPAVIGRGGGLSGATSGGLLLVAVLAAGLLSSIVATRVALSAALVTALRAE